MDDDELHEIELAVMKSAAEVNAVTFDTFGAVQRAGRRAVFNAGLARAAEIAREHGRPRGTDPFPGWVGAEPLARILAAIEAEEEKDNG